MKTLYFSDRHAEILDFNRSYLQLKAFNIERLLALLKSSWILCFPEEIKTMFFFYLFIYVFFRRPACPGAAPAVSSQARPETAKGQTGTCGGRPPAAAVFGQSHQRLSKSALQCTSW